MGQVDPVVRDIIAHTDGLSLAQLLDACSRFLDVRIEFQPSQLTRPFHPLPGAQYSAHDLLAAANRELEVEGLTTVRPAGSDVLRVVPLDQAKAVAGLHSSDGSLALGDRPMPGYLRVIVPLEATAPEDLQASLRRLSSPHGEVEAVGKSRSLLISDLTPRVTTILYVLRGLDVPGPDPVIEEYLPRHVGAKLLATRLEQLSAKHKAVADAQLVGSSLVLVETGELLFLAPPDEIGWWLREAERLDRPEPVQTYHYTPRRFGLAETRGLIQEHLAASPLQAPEPRIVTDELTGALIITATPTTHASINDLLNRLERTESTPEPRLRAFQIGNRPAEEVQALLAELLTDGVLGSPGDGVGYLEGGTGGPVDAEVHKATARPFKSGPSLGQGEVSLTVDPTNNQILAFGPPKLLDRVEVLIDTLDLRQPQVLVEATVISLSETEASSLGIELAAIAQDGDELYQLASLFGLGAPGPSELALPALSGTGTSGTVLNPGSFSAAIRALETVTDGRSLSRPKLLVNAGRTADLGSTLQTPYTSTNASSTVSTTSLGGTLDAGTEILVTPMVAEGGRIVIEYTVSLSSFVGEAADPNLPPPRQENHITSEVTIPDGHTLVVGGLEIQNEGTDRVAVPLLGQVPLLGWLFRDDASSSSRNRFYVFLKCSIMDQDRFEGLRYVSELAREVAGVPGDWPAVEPMVMR